MTKEYNGEEKRSQVNSALRILIGVQRQTHTQVIELAKSVSRNNSLVIGNGIKLDTAIEYNKECDKRLTEVELWKAGHVGEGLGKAKLTDRIGVKITLLCTVGALIIAGSAFYFAELKPALDKSTGVYNKIAAIEQKYQELLKP